MDRHQSVELRHPADRLNEAIRTTRAPVCVGIDPVFDRLPTRIKMDETTEARLASIEAYVLGVIDAVAAHVPCVKFQSACFERYRGAGVTLLYRCMTAARQCGLIVILDAKRGDIGISSRHYADSAFEGLADSPTVTLPQWITINAYLGDDGIRPFLVTGGGAFALVRTSNPGGDALQAAVLDDGRTVAELVADLVNEIGQDYVGHDGFSALGAVVGATKSDEAVSLRQRMPRQVFLVPGFGAQGGAVESVLPMFRSDGLGAIVTASRSVGFAFRQDDPGWQRAISDAAADFADQVGRATGWRS